MANVVVVGLIFENENDKKTQSTRNEVSFFREQSRFRAFIYVRGPGFSMQPLVAVLVDCASCLKPSAAAVFSQFEHSTSKGERIGKSSVLRGPQ